MEANAIGDVLLEDVQTNFAWIQMGVLAASVLIATLGAILAARATTMLSEARHLYWRISEMEKSLLAEKSRRKSYISSTRPTANKKKPPRRDRTVV